MRIIVFSLILLLVATGFDPVPEQDMPVPVEVQYPLLIKVLSYDRQLQARMGDEVVIGVIYQERYRASRSAGEAFISVAKASPVRTISGVPVRVVPIKYEDAAGLVRAIEGKGIDVVYVAPLRAAAVESLAQACRRRGVTTLTGVPEYIAAGLAVGIGRNAQQKPEILVNVEAARAEGAQLSAQVLNLATLIEKRS